MSEDFYNRSTKSRQLADRLFQHIETLAYVVLGLLLAIAALLGIADAGVDLFRAAQSFGDTEVLVVAIDGLLFVLMVVEILHTVRASFRSGTLVCEPFLIVGLIASIRRVLVITLESSQVNKPGNWSADSEAIIHSTMLELAVLGALIFVMVVSIYMLRRSDRPGWKKGAAPGDLTMDA
jgi:uncharacterized membrane protein (DUF373 family)